MQPNQQEPNQQPQPSPPAPHAGYVSPSGSTVPEFLHMDPIAQQAPPKSHKLKKLLVIGGGVLILLAVGVAAYLYVISSQQSSSLTEQRLYGALENLMQVKYVHREYKAETKEPARTISISADSDSTDPAMPKSAITFTADMGNDGSGVKKYAGEYRVVKPGEYAGILTSATPNALPKGTALNQWYRFTTESKPRKTIERSVNSLESRSTINTTQGPVIIGNFSEENRLQLLELIKSKSVYTIDANQNVVSGNESVIHLAINPEALNELNQRVTELYKLDSALKISATTADKMQLHIDATSSRITKIIYTNSNLYKKTITFTYPESINATYPENIKDAK